MNRHTYFVDAAYRWVCPICKTEVSISTHVAAAMARHPAGASGCPACGSPIAVTLADGVLRVEVEAADPGDWIEPLSTGGDDGK